jgi:hypothetical protein
MEATMEAKVGMERAKELMAEPEFVAMFEAEADGTNRFLVLADWCRDRDAERDCPALVLALRAKVEPVKIGPKVYRVGRSISTGGYWVQGQVTGRRLRGRMSGFEFVGPNFRDAVGVIHDVLLAEAMKAGARKAKSAAAEKLKAEWVNPFKVGDLLSNSWGYEQTNWDFAQVVAVGKRSVTIRPVGRRTIEDTGAMSAYVAPVKDAFAGEEKVVRFTFSVYGGKLHARLPARHGSWSAVGDREKFLETWYA